MRTLRARYRGTRAIVTAAALALVCAIPGLALQAGDRGKQGASLPPRGSQSVPENKLFSPLPEFAPDIDASVPPVAPNVSCPSAEVLQAASERVKELASILPQFTATERVEHREAGRGGKWRPPHTVTFKYLAELQHLGPKMLHMEELRNGTSSPSVFPAGLADVGLPAIVLVFHPYFIHDYRMECEGRGQWEGRPAWQIHFQQRPDRSPRLRVYIVGDRSYAVKLKGRAWIDTATGQVVHVETDLLEPVPQIRLIREHLVIDYYPVQFRKKNVELWLPKTADVYMNFLGRVYYRRHSFDDFLLFSVDVDQKVSDPKAP